MGTTPARKDAPLRLACILAHPDDETLGFGGALSRYSAEGVETYVVTATRGQAGRYKDNSDHPGPEALGRIREQELRDAARLLGVREVQFLDYHDGQLDTVDVREAIAKIVAHLRRIRPHVVATFAPDGGYGHPDHIAISQLAAAAILRAADAGYTAPSAGDPGAPHAVSKLYYMAWSHATWDAYQAAFKKLISRVDGVERQAAPWPDWEITTVVDTSDHWRTVWKAVQCHVSQMTIYGPLANLSEAHHRQLWGKQELYRAMSLVNGGRRQETDLFEGLR
jgi:LmbE family N-acetylglucosaminyl deacetylase